MPETEVLQLPGTGAASNAKNRRAVRAVAFGAGRDVTVVKVRDDVEPGMSKEATEDPFEALASDGKVIEPPFDLLALAMMPERSTELLPVLEAMEINIEGFGHRLVSRVDIDKIKGDSKEDKALRKAVRKEHTNLTNFFAYASLRDSFTALRRKLRRDIESTGNGYWEVITNAAGDINQLNHLPSYQMRLGVLDSKQLKVAVPILELQDDGSVKVEEIQSWERFRLFVQSRAIQRQNLQFTGDHRMRWFKEFGDPRTYDNRTGEEVRGDAIADLAEEHRANAVIHFRLYSPRTPYGLPRFIGNLLSIIGDRAAEEINFTTFQNNNVPSMMLMVSNGQMTDETIVRIKEFSEQLQASSNRSTFLLIEAEGPELEDGGEDGGHVKIEAIPMVGSQHNDALFQVYSKNNQEKIRRAFRLPPILVGKSDDYSRATAETSRKLADEQVFAPEREEIDAFINRRLFPVMNIIYHKYKSNSPNTTDNAELVKLLANAEKTGGMTPRIARTMLEDILGFELPPFPESFDPDVPFSLTMAEAVKNMADPTEPGQQVTALKAIDLIEKLTGGEMTDDEEDEAIRVVAVAQRHFERKFRQVASQTPSQES